MSDNPGILRQQVDETQVHLAKKVELLEQLDPRLPTPLSGHLH